LGLVVLLWEVLPGVQEGEGLSSPRWKVNKFDRSIGQLLVANKLMPSSGCGDLWCVDAVVVGSAAWLCREARGIVLVVGGGQTVVQSFNATVLICPI
jgi:hypothetical protein